MTGRDATEVMLADALDKSVDSHWDIRVDAAELLGRLIDEPTARNRLGEMLHDPGDVAVQTAAAEVLTRCGGRSGLLAVLEEIGRRADDPDADYIAYKLYELEGMGEYPVLETTSTIDVAELSPEAHLGIVNLKRLLGRQ
jgi:hypothetical protein